MQFDYIIGNPPYKADLHLKILNKVYKYLNTNGKLVWIHPSRWCTDLGWETKKHTDIEKYFHLPFQKFEFININKANEIFNIALFGDGLIISSIDNTKKAYYNTIENLIIDLKEQSYNSKLILPIFNKIKSKIDYTLANKIKNGDMLNELFSFLIKQILRGTFEAGIGSYNIISSNHGIYENGKYNGKTYGENRHQARNKNGKINYKTNIIYLSFNTKEEAKNCYDSFKTLFYRFITKLFNNDMHLNLKIMPYMENYIKPWTNERFYIYFDLTIDEQKEIEKIMKPYC